jgi:hypothetical protein
MRIAQILWNKAHLILESEDIPNYPPDPSGCPIIFIDITDKPEVMEGWDYNNETGEFTRPESEVPIEPQPSIDEIIRANYLETQYQTVLMEMQSGI